MGLRLAACESDDGLWLPDDEQWVILADIAMSLVVLGCMERYSEGWMLTDFGGRVAAFLKANNAIDEDIEIAM